MYGNTAGINPQKVYRIGAGGQTQPVATLPAGRQYYVGDIDSNGQYWLAAPLFSGGFYWTQINLNPDLPNLRFETPLDASRKNVLTL